MYDLSEHNTRYRFKMDVWSRGDVTTKSLPRHNSAQNSRAGFCLYSFAPAALAALKAEDA